MVVNLKQHGFDFQACLAVSQHFLNHFLNDHHRGSVWEVDFCQLLRLTFECLLRPLIDAIVLVIEVFEFDQADACKLLLLV